MNHGLHVGAICVNDYGGEYSSFIKNKISNYDGIIYHETTGLGIYKSTHEDTCEKLIFKDGKLISATGNPNDTDNNTENNTENNANNNADNNIGNNTENDTNNNTDNNIVNNTGNNTKLPQTGEETNTFARWLSIAIALGLFWLSSMLLIEREKKKMIKR